MFVRAAAEVQDIPRRSCTSIQIEILEKLLLTLGFVTCHILKTARHVPTQLKAMTDQQMSLMIYVVTFELIFNINLNYYNLSIM